jgi:hypothetical protein
MDPLQLTDLGYVEVLIAHGHDLRPASRSQAPLYPLEQGFVCVVVTEDIAFRVNQLSDDAGYTPDDEPPEFVPTATLGVLGLEMTPQRPYAYIAASPDHQWGAVYTDGALLLSEVLSNYHPPVQGTSDRDLPANAALRRLGVRIGAFPDETTALDLVLPTLTLPR